MPLSRREFLGTTGAAGASMFVSHVLPGCRGTGEPDAPTLPEDPEGRWWLSGNYAPVADEIEAVDLPVEGAIPPELDGIYVRNGPNPPSGESSGWFFGDGMLHGVRIGGGRARWYRNRYIRTEAYTSGQTASGEPPLTANLANTALIHHAGRALALYEAGRPHRIDLTDLSTVGEYDFDGALTGPMTAHPKLDPETGELVFFGTSPFPPHVTIHFADARGELVRSEPIELPGARMIHDFSLTARHVVLYDLPVTFDLETIANGGFPFVWKPELGARLGVMPREGSDSDVQWFDIDPCYVFHSFNAYEDDDGRVTLEACRHDHIWAEGPHDESSQPLPWRWTIDLQQGRVSETQLDDRLLEFPRIDPRRQTRRNRIGYGLRFEPGRTAVDPKRPAALVKHDLARGEVEEWAFQDGRQPDEAVFVPAPSADAEDGGWLMSFVFDPGRRRSELMIFEASAPSDGPVARIDLPRRVPFGFHGDWFPTAG